MSCFSHFSLVLRLQIFFRKYGTLKLLKFIFIPYIEIIIGEMHMILGEVQNCLKL